MIRSIAKHSYIRGHNGMARANAHINYIAFRGGEDREPGGRIFFDSRRNDISPNEIKQLLYESDFDRNVIIHKFILSPGIQEVDIADYTRELMTKLEHEKHLELEWKAVVHDNTYHKHAHVIIMSLDKDGHRVRFNKEDYKHLRQYGDAYLDREHKLERYLDHDLQQLLRSKDYDRGGDDRFREMIYGRADRQLDLDPKDRNDLEHHRKDRSDPERDRREYEMFDEDMRKASSDEFKSGFRAGRQQRIREQQGRLSDSHSDYSLVLARERLEQLAIKDPELAEATKAELDFLHELVKEDRLNQHNDQALNRLLGFDQHADRNRDQHQEIQSNSWKTFEIDRNMRDQTDDKEQDDRERKDDNGGEIQ